MSGNHFGQYEDRRTSVLLRLQVFGTGDADYCIDAPEKFPVGSAQRCEGKDGRWHVASTLGGERREWLS